MFKANTRVNIKEIKESEEAKFKELEEVFKTRFLSHMSKRSPTPNLGCQSPDEGRRID